MKLCLDIGNTHVFGGIFQEDGSILTSFRYETKDIGTSDQFGLFLINYLKLFKINRSDIESIGVSSVVPSVNYSISSACYKYLNINPKFITVNDLGMKVETDNPSQIGADLISAAIAVAKEHPRENAIIVDFGTATTLSILSRKNEYLGTIIMPGFRIAMESLMTKAAQLFSVEIKKPDNPVGKNTTASIQSGIYYQQLGAVKELIDRIKKDYFNSEKVLVIGTGGFVHLFEEENVFSELKPNLVLEGIKISLPIKNQPTLFFHSSSRK